MSLTAKINDDIKQAMLAKDRDKLAALRDIKAKLLLEATKGGSAEVSEAAEMAILNKLYKQRMEAADIYRTQGRTDLLEDEVRQSDIIKQYLPAQMTEEEIRKAVAEIIARVGAAGPSDLGKVMGTASKEMAGKADGKLISAIAKELLG
jgi:uncharacterized protein